MFKFLKSFKINIFTVEKCAYLKLFEFQNLSIFFEKLFNIYVRILKSLV
jgi:hypothetical protein